MIKRSVTPGLPGPQVERVYRAEFSVKTSRRIIEGRAVPYGIAERVSDDGGVTIYREEWAFGAFSGATVPATAGRVKLNYTHDDTNLRNWIGRTKYFEEREDGLYGEWKVDETELGDLILYKVDDEQLRGLSVAARPLETRDRGGVHVRTRALLDHVALVEQGAFADALVLAVRNAPPVPTGPSPADRLAALRALKDSVLR